MFEVFGKLDRAATAPLQQLQLGPLEYLVAPGAFFFVSNSNLKKPHPTKISNHQPPLCAYVYSDLCYNTNAFSRDVGDEQTIANHKGLARNVCWDYTRFLVSSEFLVLVTLFFSRT